MAPAAKSKAGNANNTTSNTPGRRARANNSHNNQQYFDVGKVGRKTGITLKDTGIRDEHGLEPVSGIFSSPVEQPERHGDKTLTSEGMDVQNSSAPDVTATLTQRKLPRLPPPRQSTPRHTNIGSPKRMSSTKPSAHAPPDDDDDDDESGLATSSHPPANRRLDFGTRRDTQSPFKPKKVLRRSTGPPRPDPFDLLPDDEPAARTSIEYTANGLDDDDDDVEPSIEDDNDGPIITDDVDDYPVEPEEPVQEAPSDSPLKRKRGRPRKSDQSINNSQTQITASSSKKRNRSSLNNDESLDANTTSIAPASTGRPSKKKRSSGANQVTIHRDEGTETVDRTAIAYGDEYPVDDDAGVPQQDTEVAAQLDSRLEEQAEPQPEAGARGRPPKGKKGKAAAPKERDANRGMQKRGSPVKVNDSPSKRRRGGSVGPVSNVNLRATTPFEDAGQQTSRSGRNLIQPLKFWENESRIWKSGEIEGIVRAEHVEKPNPNKGKRRKKSKKLARRRLQDIEEESETESIMADEWEESVGVITGNVASWNPTIKKGDSSVPVQEDLAFAASSIVTRDVAGSEFKYAKIMTIPFFGAGLVELPPEGFKRAKNCQKMQMVFFVHEGKVMVEVGGTGMEINQFALTKGGVWVVPRGNNYSIMNESTTKTAKVFFAQGCVVESNVGAAAAE